MAMGIATKIRKYLIIPTRLGLNPITDGIGMNRKVGKLGHHVLMAWWHI